MLTLGTKVQINPEANMYFDFDELFPAAGQNIRDLQSSNAVGTIYKIDHSNNGLPYFVDFGDENCVAFNALELVVVEE